jgi:hypothetical protein
MSPKAAPRSRAVAFQAAHDGVIGAAVGLLLASGLIASDLDIWRNLADSGQPLISLATLVAVVVAQSAAVAALGGLAVRKFGALDG